MRITLIDDSIPFDGATPNNKSLGGAEKAFVNLCEAFATRGHTVQAVNRCENPTEFNGVSWVPLERPRFDSPEVIIAFRQPSLLTEFAHVDRRYLWLWGPLSFLSKIGNKEILQRFNPTMIYLGDVHRNSWKPRKIHPEAIIVPGVSNFYLNKECNLSEPPPVAITTTHPHHAMMEILELWVSKIHPRVQNAQLHIYSAILSRLNDANENKDPSGGLLSKILKSRNYNVLIKKPMPDNVMANVYRNARLHLYPAIESEMYGNTLAESQASGLPALIRTNSGIVGAVAERVCNGQSGYITPDDMAFVNLAIEILADDSATYWSLHKDALTLQGQRSWQVAAMEFEALWS